MNNEVISTILADIEKKYPPKIVNRLSAQMNNLIQEFLQNISSETINNKIPYQADRLILEQSIENMSAGDVHSVIDNIEHIKALSCDNNLPYDISSLESSFEEISVIEDENVKAEEIRQLNRELIRELENYIEYLEDLWSDRYKESELKKLEKKIEQRYKLFDNDSGDWLSDEENSMQGFWSLMDGIQSEEDLRIIKELLNFFKDKKNIYDFCDLLGRSDEKTKKKVNEFENVLRKKEDPRLKDSIEEIHLSNDIRNLVPIELACMDIEGAPLFEIKYVEQKLLTYKIVGEEIIDSIEGKDLEVEEYKSKGPIILIIDTSASMFGEGSRIAKALALHMGIYASTNKRSCLVINFSIHYSALELIVGEGESKKLFDFLRISLNGGTDPSLALEYAVSMMSEKNYQKSDVVVISDFQMGEIKEEVIKLANETKKRGNKFYSLLVGSRPTISFDNLFDVQCRFNVAKEIEVLKDNTSTTSDSI